MIMITIKIKKRHAVVQLLRAGVLSFLLTALSSLSALAQPARFITQPKSQIVVPGTNVTFAVTMAPSVTPLLFQWQRNTTPINGATNDTLLLTNVQQSTADDYSVIVRNAAGPVTSSNATLLVVQVLSDKQSVSLGDTVTFRISTTAPLGDRSLQWRFNSADLPGATNVSLAVTNVQVTDAGVYSAVVTCRFGTAEPSAALDVDPTFTKITTGVVVADPPVMSGTLFYGVCGWADYDGDGYLDLLAVVVDPSRTVRGRNFLYHNNRDGTFTKITDGPIGNADDAFSGVAWGDYDNDGHLDLLASTALYKATVYRNQGDGTFVPLLPAFTLSGLPWGGNWVDYDQDGWLDAFLSDWAPSGTLPPNYLFRNTGAGAFTPITNNIIVTETANTDFTAWADYDNDGLPDLVAAHGDTPTALYHNAGEGVFTKVKTGPIVQDTTPVGTPCWVDYDNDGNLDLFIKPNDARSLLYHNNGDGTFVRLTNVIPFDPREAATSFPSWGDYDNDGFLDFFVTGSQGNYLFRNNGDGSFTRITTGSPANDRALDSGAAWGDFDNDGFLDLMVAVGTRPDRKNFLYRNNRNSNSWLEITLVGKASNRSGIGAQVRARATIGGKTIWQMRLISCDSPSSSGGNLRAHFGFGDATNVDIVRIEWPSGIVQELSNVPTNQFLTVTEAGAGILPRWHELVVGSNYTFRAASTLPAPVIHQWQRYGTNLVGETNATLIIPNAQVADAGEYTVAVSTADGAQSQTSFSALLTLPGAPIIRVQPQSQIVVAGSTVEFKVHVIPSTAPPAFQWQIGSVVIGGATNATLTLTNVALAKGGDYTVVVSSPAGSVTSDVAGLTVVQDASISASLGGNAMLWVKFGGPPPLNYQWRLNGTDIPGRTASRYVLTNAQPADVGQYSVVVTNPAGTVTIPCPALLIDPTFTKITTDPVAYNAWWGDIDNDGYLDLVAIPDDSAPVLYHNNRDGTFGKMIPWSLPGFGSGLHSAAFGDYNNDGYLDLLAGSWPGIYARLLRNNGDGTFTNVVNAAAFSKVASVLGIGWVDFNNDGWVDAFVGGTLDTQGSILFQNNGEGMFSVVTNSGLANVGLGINGAAWADYDNDGYPDLFSTAPTANLLYHNKGDGTFARIKDPPTNPQFSAGCAWGDYDNDGFPDLFVAISGGAGLQKNFLYHNEGNGTFRKIAAGDIVSTLLSSASGSWGDYDNDGFLDLFVSNLSPTNALYHNNGDGTLTAISLGSLTSDSGIFFQSGWADYDNDGFLDLFVGAERNSLLYRNNGNSNSWVKVQCVGALSNRAAIGAKVRVRAFYRGASRWQLREITGGDGLTSMQPLLAHFGLGDAANIDTIRIEWPSGIVQDVLNVGTNQFLTVTEQGVGILPFKQLAVAGSNYTFRAATTLAGPVAYQWRLGTNDLAGETNATLTITGAQRQDTGEYSVVVSDGTESMTSQSVVLYWPEPPVITQQPKSQIVLAGTNVKFTVGVAPNPVPATFQWQQNTYDVAGATNATLLLTNVSTAKGGDYTVVVSNPAGSVTSDLAGLTVVQDASLSGSLGGNVRLQFRYVGPPPASCQWQFNGKDIAGATRATLSITNAQLADVGDYSVVVANAAGSVTNHAPPLVVDPTFTKITTGPVVSDGGDAIGNAWGDYDNDGFVDLFVANGVYASMFTGGIGVPGNSFLYHNNGDGTFARVNDGPLATMKAEADCAAFGDYDNDGFLDLLIAVGGVLGSYPSMLWHNNGDGAFTRITNSPIATTPSYAWSGSWVDYNNDGFLDAFVANSNGQNDLLFRNNGDGTFTRMTTNDVGSIVNDRSDSDSAAWADYDNDGWADVFVAIDGSSFYTHNLLYRNLGNGTFERITSGIVVAEGGSSLGGAWGDYDNDGWPDLFVANDFGGRSFLYHNLGNGSFEKVTTGPIPADSVGLFDIFAIGIGCWGDYDNDGFLDLFVARSGTSLLYHNNGDGTFTSIKAGSIVNDRGSGGTASWQDYDSDGFLDLFVGNDDGGRTKNFLYHNNGNANAWLVIKPVGTTSNRSGIGAKVRVLATYAGKARWQLREIGSTESWKGPNLYGHFGLGNATNVMTLRIEWPSGTVQELHDVAPRQLLTVTEPPGLAMPRPGELQVTAWSNMTHRIEASTNLVQWMPLDTVTNQARTNLFTDPEAATLRYRFYRAVKPSEGEP